MFVFPCITAAFRLGLITCFAILLMARVNANDYGQLRITVETVLAVYSGHGYDEYRATIINRSATASHRVAIVLFDHGYGSAEDLVRREIEVGPSATMTMSLFSPSWHNGNRAAIWIDGVRQQERAEIDTSKTGAVNSRAQNRFFMLLSRDVEKARHFDAKTVTEGFSAEQSYLDVAYSLSTAAPSEWSPNWLGYTGFSGIALTAEEISTMPESSRLALLRYAESGGVLFVVGSWTPPDSWRINRVPVQDVPLNSTPAAVTEPDGDDETAKSEEKKREVNPTSSTTPNALEAYKTGFGMAIVTGTFPFEQITSGQWKYIKDAMPEIGTSVIRYSSISMLNKNFPLVDRLGVPVRGLFALILGFILLIGPVNFFWFAGPGKRMRMLWTVPVISLLTCLAVAGFSLYGEGTQASARTDSLTILNDIDHRAATIGVVGYYSPVANDGLHFSQDVEISPLTWDGSNRDKLTMDFSHDQHLGPGWVTPRIPRFLQIRKSENRRERLSVQWKGNDAPAAVNGFGVPIKQLWLATPEGQMYLADNVEPGATAAFRKAAARPALGTMSPQSIFHAQDWGEAFNSIEQIPESLLKPGSYLAFVDRNPFVEDALANVATRRGRSFIYGRIPEGAK
jgi:hypothetical protein